MEFSTLHSVSTFEDQKSEERKTGNDHGVQSNLDQPESPRLERVFRFRGRVTSSWKQLTQRAKKVAKKLKLRKATQERLNTREIVRFPSPETAEEPLYHYTAESLEMMAFNDSAVFSNSTASNTSPSVVQGRGGKDTKEDKLLPSLREKHLVFPAADVSSPLPGIGDEESTESYDASPRRLQSKLPCEEEEPHIDPGHVARLVALLAPHFYPTPTQGKCAEEVKVPTPREDRSHKNVLQSLRDDPPFQKDRPEDESFGTAGNGKTSIADIAIIGPALKEQSSAVTSASDDISPISGVAIHKGTDLASNVYCSNRVEPVLFKTEMEVKSVQPSVPPSATESPTVTACGNKDQDRVFNPKQASHIDASNVDSNAAAKTPDKASMTTDPGSPRSKVSQVAEKAQLTDKKFAQPPSSGRTVKKVLFSIPQTSIVREGCTKGKEIYSEPRSSEECTSDRDVKFPAALKVPADGKYAEGSPASQAPQVQSGDEKEDAEKELRLRQRRERLKQQKKARMQKLSAVIAKKEEPKSANMNRNDNSCRTASGAEVIINSPSSVVAFAVPSVEVKASLPVSVIPQTAHNGKNKRISRFIDGEVFVAETAVTDCAESETEEVSEIKTPHLLPKSHKTSGNGNLLAAARWAREEAIKASEARIFRLEQRLLHLMKLAFEKQG